MLGLDSAVRLDATLGVAAATQPEALLDVGTSSRLEAVLGYAPASPTDIAILIETVTQLDAAFRAGFAPVTEAATRVEAVIFGLELPIWLTFQQLEATTLCLNQFRLPFLHLLGQPLHFGLTLSIWIWLMLHFILLFTHLAAWPMRV